MNKYSKKCVKNCEIGFYKDTTHNVCEPCSQNCRSCDIDNSTKCLTCKTGTYLNDTKCVANCPPDKYGDDATITCIACNDPTEHNCATCTSLEFCTSCKATFYLDYI